MSPRIRLVIFAAVLLMAAPVHVKADTAGSLAAYFEGDSIREALLKLTPAYDTAVRRLSRTLDQTRRFIRAQIIVVRDGGALVSVKSYSSAEIGKDTPEPLEQTFFVYGLPGDVAGGAVWEGQVYPAGKFGFTAADKSEQSVTAVAVTKEWALRAMESVSKETQ